MKQFTISMEDATWNEIAIGVLTTAAEGGIGYWADYRTERKTDEPFEGWVTRIYGFEDAEEGGSFSDTLGYTAVTAVELEKAFRGILNGDVKCGSYCRKQYESALRDGDACNIDIDGADVLVQVALFGEIVFG